MEYSSDKSLICQEQIISFIKLVDIDFIPPLSSRVDICSWVKKFFPLVQIVWAKSDNDLKGLMVFYNNNILERKAYVSYIAVTSDCRGQGIASKLLDISFNICRKSQMNLIGIETNNPEALRLYIKLGFRICKETYYSEVNYTRYYLEKVL